MIEKEKKRAREGDREGWEREDLLRSFVEEGGLVVGVDNDQLAVIVDVPHLVCLLLFL